jgi:hypothetical protein
MADAISAMYDEDADDVTNVFFDEDKARQAAKAVKIFQDVSVGSTMKKQSNLAEEERKTNEQKQRFAEKDEDRDYRQAQQAYRF